MKLRAKIITILVVASLMMPATGLFYWYFLEQTHPPSSNIILISTLFSLITILIGTSLSYTIEGDLEKYKTFYKSSKDALMTLSPPKWNFTSANEATIKMFGVKDEKEFTSLGPWDISPEKQPDGQLSSEKVKKMIERAMKSGSNYFEWTHKKYKGENFYASVLLTRIRIGKKAFLQATVRDISKERQQKNEIKRKSEMLEWQKGIVLNAMDELQRQKSSAEKAANDLKKFKLAVDNASDLIIITDPEGMVLYGNKMVEKITGYRLEETIGRKAGTLWSLPMKKEYYENLWDIIKNKKQVFIGALQNKRKNRKIYDTTINISPVLDENGRVVYFVGIEHDITKEKQIDRAKTEFVSLASHQLRTPLSTINWYTEMLLAGDAGKLNSEQKKFLDEIYSGNQRMVELVNSLLNVSRLELGTFMIEPELCSLKEIAKQVVKEILPKVKERKQALKEEYSNNLEKTNLDKKLTDMIIENLLSNATKYTPEKGKIKLSITKDKDNYIISVSDNGMGIPKDAHEKIFTKLYRADNVRETDTVGTGLGLYMVKSILEQFGGKIWFESKKNKGTTFFVSIPVAGMKRKQGEKKLS